MEVYSNENEQVDALRQFFANNGKALLVGIAIGIVVLVGWRYWATHQEDESREVSARYQALTQAMQADKPQTLEAVARFTSENNNTYGALAALELAKRYVDANQLDKAAAQLKNGLNDTKDSGLQAVLNLRLARIQLQQNQADAALKSLSNIKGEGWTAIVAEIRGDALLSKGDKQAAREAWNKGVTSDASPALKQIIQMKINNLS